MKQLHVKHGLHKDLPINRDNDIMYHTTDKGDFYIGNTRYIKESEYNLHEERIEILENESSNNQSSLTKDIKKSMIQYYKYIGSQDSSQKTYTNNIISSIKDMEEFAKLGTGLFIHWGVYSVPAGHYEGIDSRGNYVTKDISYNCEWSMRDLGIPMDVYKSYEDRFTGENFNAEELVKKVVDCGMKYIILTVKHHEGFSLYPTSYGTWDVRTSACRNTIVDELSAECKKCGIKLGFYYSQYWDWMTEGGFGLDHNKKWCDTDPYTETQHMGYCNRAIKQINEMVEKYDPYILWYDPGTAYNSKYVNIFVNSENNNYPQIITNDRLDYGRNYGDYGTGERTIYVRNKLKYGESCFTLNDTWGYSVNNDNKYYTLEKIFKQFLLYTLSYGQNCVLNVGPKPNGEIPQKQIDVLNAIQNFIEAYGKFTGYKRVNSVSRPKWGYMIELPNNTIMCYVVMKNNTDYSDIVIDCVDIKNLTSVDILTNDGNPSYEINNGKVYIHGLTLDNSTKVGVIRLNYETEPIILDANYLSADEMLPSRTFVMKNGLTFDFSDYTYTTKASLDKQHFTEFIWDGDTADYNCELSFTTTSTTDTITVVVKNIEDSTYTSLTYLNDAYENDTLVNLVNGKRYELMMNFSGTSTETIKINGVTFKENVEVVHPTSIELDNHTLKLNENETAQLNVTILPENTTDKSVTWETSDATIATVENGLVTAISVGDVRITVKTNDGNKTDECALIVESEAPYIPVESITLNETETTIKIGNSTQLEATINPSTATHKGIEWSTSNPSIALVYDGLVTAIGEGNVVITAKAIEDNVTATCNVLCEIQHVESVTLNYSNMTTGKEGAITHLEATILPEDATIKNVIWSSSDETIVTVDDNGTVTPQGLGEATITVTSEEGDKTATCNFEVIDIDYVLARPKLSGNEKEGVEPGIQLFDDEHQNWTIFSYAQNSLNTGQADNNATLYAIYENKSPWSGLRVDADNNNFPRATKTYAPLLPRMNAGSDNYINPVTGAKSSTKQVVDPTAKQHPVCISRNGTSFKYSIDGITWNDITGQTESRLNDVKAAKITIGYDYKRASGEITTTKYRLLKTEYPCCVAIIYESEYPFTDLYERYYSED